MRALSIAGMGAAQVDPVSRRSRWGALRYKAKPRVRQLTPRLPVYRFALPLEGRGRVHPLLGYPTGYPRSGWTWLPGRSPGLAGHFATRDREPRFRGTVRFGFIGALAEISPSSEP